MSPRMFEPAPVARLAAVMQLEDAQFGLGGSVGDRYEAPRYHDQVKTCGCWWWCQVCGVVPLHRSVEGVAGFVAASDRPEPVNLCRPRGG